jgi:hypothetical protein
MAKGRFTIEQRRVPLPMELRRVTMELRRVTMELRRSQWSRAGSQH